MLRLVLMRALFTVCIGCTPLLTVAQDRTTQTSQFAEKPPTDRDLAKAEQEAQKLIQALKGVGSAEDGTSNAKVRQLQEQAREYLEVVDSLKHELRMQRIKAARAKLDALEQQLEQAVARRAQRISSELARRMQEGAGESEPLPEAIANGPAAEGNRAIVARDDVLLQVASLFGKPHELDERLTETTKQLASVETEMSQYTQEIENDRKQLAVHTSPDAKDNIQQRINKMELRLRDLRTVADNYQRKSRQAKREQKSAVMMLESALSEAQEGLVAAETQLNTESRLVKQGFAPESTLLGAQANVRKAQARIRRLTIMLDLYFNLGN